MEEEKKAEFKKVEELFKNNLAPLEKAPQEKQVYQKKKKGRREHRAYSNK